ncbi:MAG: hypothetical protein AAFU85_05030 [Planctomycetota bacterium]
MIRRTTLSIAGATVLVALSVLAAENVLSQDAQNSPNRDAASKPAKLKFESLQGQNPDWTLYRAKIPGGWLVTNQPGPNGGKGLAYVPDPNHQWDGGSID